MGFYSDFPGFYSKFTGCSSDLVGFQWDVPSGKRLHSETSTLNGGFQ